ncbi:Carboxylesterase [Seminavis robusta]|uniref:Carboxylesterase n=1 Tax=Seminavis robusta TaxID=568900 RepID=A0A9N8E063_9STRA|nr:Carboxylesterase [Seminavis robusta]|eukprot:Sro518_g158890.1 Carboxylesterase (414) ;mRNA; f:49917-51158
MARISHILNTLLVVLPLANVWRIAKAKNLLVSGSSFQPTSDEDPPPVYMASLLLILVLGCKVIASMIDWLSARQEEDTTNAAERALHHSIRDSGFFFYLMEIMSVDKVVPTVLKYPGVLARKFRLSRHKRVIHYGQQSSSQKIEIYLPAQTDEFRKPASGLVVFVHGGAWGSGGPASYELMADTFMDVNWAIAVVGYRVYPEGDASTQIQDVELAVAEIAKFFPLLCQNNVFLFGHSSGAHVCMLAIVERARRDLEVSRISSAAALDRRRKRINFDGLIGMSGPYNIDRHYDYEAGRGVEQISPMSPANGHSRQMFLRFSPAVQLVDIASQCTSEDERQAVRCAIPPITLIHGLNDKTVPHSATEEAARLLKTTDVADCKEIYVDDTGHEQTIMELMLGGPVQDIFTKLLQEQ